MPTLSFNLQVFFKSNESNYDEMAEKIGELVMRKELKKDVKPSQQMKQVRPAKKVKQVKKIQRPVVKESSTSNSSDEDERIYDFPPANEAKVRTCYFAILTRTADTPIFGDN